MKSLKTIITICLINFAVIALPTFAVQKTTSSYDVVQLSPETSPPTPTESPSPKTALASSTKTKAPTSTKAPQTPAPVVVSNRCIIVVDSVKYDITDFRKIHSGGDIFQCNTDMTQIFYGQHNASTLLKLARYKIN